MSGRRGTGAMAGWVFKPVAQMFDTNATNLKRWRRNVAGVAKTALTKRQAEGLAALDGPLHMSVAFRFPMPKSRPARDFKRGWKWKDTSPDIDKLVRAIGDALDSDAKLIVNDARICSLVCSQVETVNEHDVGCTTQVYTLDHEGEPAGVRPLHPYR